MALTPNTKANPALKKVAAYTSKNIETLVWPDTIRKNASQYIGGTDSSGLWLVVRELMDNGLDEGLAGRNDAVLLHVDSDGSFWVLDRGHGIPQGVTKTHIHVNGKDVVNKMDTMQAAFGALHTSGKYDSEAYEVSIGCFVGSTQVRIAKGNTVAFKELYERWTTNKEPIPIVAWDVDNDVQAQSFISHVQLTKYVDELVRVTLSDGSVIENTPDHPYYVRTDYWTLKVQAQQLEPGQMLITPYTHSELTVISVETFHTTEPVPVYGMTVDNQHTYFIEPGVLVSNTHGIGAKGTNATAEFFDVHTFYENQWYSVGFKKGKLTSPVAKCKAPKGPDGTLVKKGTVIHFKPDASIFSTNKFPGALALEWAEIMAYFNPGFAIIISTPRGKRQFLSKTGVAEYVQARLDKFKVGAESKYFEYKSEPGDPNAADVVVSFSNYDGCDLRGFTNGLPNSQGGKHVDSVVSALYAGLKPHIKTRTVKGKVILPFRESDFKEGLVGLVNAKLHKAKFNSQDKVKLSDERMGPEFQKKLTVATIEFFKANKALASRLCERATKLNELKTKFTMSKKAAATLNAVKRNGLPAKYASFDMRTKVADRELFIVEGESAGGSAKEARFPYQAVLPLKGKVKNALKKDKKGTTLESEEIVNILAAIGYDAKAVDPCAKLTVGKIICLADPDPDGPFIGDTQIRVRSMARSQSKSEDFVWTEHTATIRGLANSSLTQERGNTAEQLVFEVPVWHHGKEIWAPATAQLVKNVDRLMAFEIGRSKFRVDENHKWVCVVTRAMYGRDTEPHPEHEKLVYVKSKDMKVGDRVWCPSNNHLKDQALTDKESGLGYQAVSKLRVQELKEPVPVYCLTVPRYHSFVLPSGVVSSNCHINSLLLSLFYKYLPDLFTRGLIYVANSPEFYAIHKDQLVCGETLSQVQVKLKKIKAPSSTLINHVKGYGEIDVDLMRIMAMDPATRSLIKIKALESEDHVDFVRLMNEDVAYRRDMLGLPANATGGNCDSEG